MEALVIILLCTIAAYFLGELCKLIHIPRVVGQIAAGMFLGIPIIENFLTPSGVDVIKFLADVGMVLLFFFVGLEINLREFRKNIKESSAISLCNTSLPLLIGFFVVHFGFGLSVTTSLIIGVCLAVSAQVISIDFLEELNLLKTRIGNLIVDAGAVDDIFELILISVIITIINTSMTGVHLSNLFLDILAFIALLVFFRIFIIPFILKVVEREHSATSLFTGSLIITLLLAVLTDFLQLGSLIGSLFAGILVRQILLTGKERKPWEQHAIAKTMHVISFGFLVPMLFVWIGISTDIQSVVQHPVMVLILTLIAFGGTIVGTMLGVLLNGGTMREGYVVGWGLNPKGDVELVIATIALQNGLITKDIFSALIVMAIATTLISPIVFRYLIKKEAPLLHREHMI